MHKYLPHTASDIKEMLDKIGIKTIDELFVALGDIKLTKPLDIPSKMSENELRDHFGRLASKNKNLLSFCGLGSYESYDFSIIDALISRQEFLTSYTPYQPEVSQGTLQYIFEFQSYVCELTGMDIANASMYDGASSTAEAIFMAVAATRKNKVLLSKTINPYVLEVVKTYSKYRDLEVEYVLEKDFSFDLEDLKKKLNNDVACFVAQTPNVYGVLEDYSKVKATLEEIGALFIINQEPSSLALFKAPSEYNADIACGDMQSLGLKRNFGGPSVGYIATISKYQRRLPGRIVGKTVDVQGKRGYVLTLQAREQHIRREKATSNICSNQSLMALTVSIYLSLVGKLGLIELSKRAYNNAHYLEEELLKTKKFKKVTSRPFYQEFVLEYLGNPKLLEQKLLALGYLSGYNIKDNLIIFYASEVRTKDEIDGFVKKVGEV